MNRSEYLDTRNKLIDDYSGKFNFQQDENLNGQFNMVSAGLVNYLPSISFDRHEEIFGKILLHKKLSILEQSSYNILDHIETENLDNDTLNLLKNKPSVICTFHTGSYRIINLFLMKHAIPYSLVIGKEIIDKEGENFYKLYSDLSANGKRNDFRLIDAESANSGLQMLRELKQGRSLLLYIDGNLGAGAQTAENNNCCIIDFLHQQIHARKGISFLAHAAKVPLLTTMSYRSSWDNIRLKFFEPIIPQVTKDRLLFAEEATQKIYNLASSIIQEYPEQWEAWLYIHKVAKIIHPGNNFREVNSLDAHSGQLLFNTRQFGILKINGVPYLFSKYSYSFYPITNKLFDFLTECNLHPVKNENIDGILINELLREGVLVTAK